MAAIKFEEVTKQYGNVTAVKNADFEIADGEFMVLVGPSGCGKSTLLRMVAGLEEISSGKLYIDEKVVNSLPPKDRDIAIVFQNYALYPHMTAFDNLAFGLKIRGMKKQVIREKVMEAAGILDIEPLLDRKPKAMSGGQRQRIAIGRAIVRDPKVFLFDEPLSNLDAKLRGQMRLEIANLHQKLKSTVLYVTHDQVEAMTLGDRIAVINKGVIQQIDTPQNLYNFPVNRFVAGFIGTPPMNFMEGRFLQKDGGFYFENTPKTIHLQIGDPTQLIHYGEKNVIMGIRPEHIHSAPVHTITDYARFHVNIKLVERLGYESFAFANTGEQPITSRLPADVPIEAPCQMELYLEIDKIHFFATESGEVIERERNSILG